MNWWQCNKSSKFRYLDFVSEIQLSFIKKYNKKTFEKLLHFKRNMASQEVLVVKNRPANAGGIYIRSIHMHFRYFLKQTEFLNLKHALESKRYYKTGIENP